MKAIIQWIIKRFKYANKIDIVKGILDGIDDKDVKNLYRVIDGRINPILKSDSECNYKTISLSDIIKDSTLIIIQDNNIIGFSKFKLTYINRWTMTVIIDGVEQEIVDDEHTKVYLLI